MQFSIYSELQTWPGKTQQQVYAEALEQVVNADRLGYATYSIIEHFFFPKFGASPNPFAFFAKASERARNIKFRTRRCWLRRSRSSTCWSTAATSSAWDAATPGYH
jgi:hypothetical protein